MERKSQSYVLGDYSDEKSRQIELCLVFDNHSIRQLNSLPIQEGWSCVDLGGGTGSVARWLADKVGTTGHVQLIDIDTSLSGESDSFEVVKRDVRELQLHKNSFNLIHTRLLLTHLRERKDLLDRLYTWLKPGGYLVIEEMDFATGFPLEEETQDGQVVAKLAKALKTAFVSYGIDIYFGRRVPLLLQDLGMKEIRSEGFVPIGNGGTALSNFQRGSMRHLLPMVSKLGLVSPEEIEKYIELRKDPRHWVADFSLISTIGQK